MLPTLARHPRKHAHYTNYATHASTPQAQARHLCHPRKHVISQTPNKFTKISKEVNKTVYCLQKQIYLVVPLTFFGSFYVSCKLVSYKKMFNRNRTSSQSQTSHAK